MKIVNNISVNDKSNIYNIDYISNNFGLFNIVHFENKSNITIKFKYSGYVTKTNYGKFKTGNVRDPLFPSFYGKGCLGFGKYCRRKDAKAYSKWAGMLYRSYTAKPNTSYYGCFVREDWLNFQQFCSDYYNMIGYNNDWELDKDILFIGNKMYSKDTCVLVPRQINSLILKASGIRGNFPIGVSFDASRNKFMSSISINNKKYVLGLFNTVEEAFLTYKEAKENEIKRIAEKYKSEIDIRAYNALVNYKVIEE